MKPSSTSNSSAVSTAHPACIIVSLPKDAQEAYVRAHDLQAPVRAMISRLGFSITERVGKHGSGVITIKHGRDNFLRFERDLNPGGQTAYRARYFSTSSSRWITFSPEESTDCWTNFLGEGSQDLYLYRMLLGRIRIML